MSNNTKLTLCPCLLIQQAMTQLFMWRQREGKAPACLWLSNQATGPIAAQRRKRDAGNDYCMTKSVYSLHIQIRRVGSINESQMARICPFFFFFTLLSRKEMTQWDNWSLHFQMLMKYTCVHCRDRIHAEWKSRCDSRLNAKRPTGNTAWCRQCVLNRFLTPREWHCTSDKMGKIQP